MYCLRDALSLLVGAPVDLPPNVRGEELQRYAEALGLFFYGTGNLDLVITVDFVLVYRTNGDNAHALFVDRDRTSEALAHIRDNEIVCVITQTPIT